MDLEDALASTKSDVNQIIYNTFIESGEPLDIEWTQRKRVTSDGIINSGDDFYISPFIEISPFFNGLKVQKLHKSSTNNECIGIFNAEKRIIDTFSEITITGDLLLTKEYIESIDGASFLVVCHCATTAFPIANVTVTLEPIETFKKIETDISNINRSIDTISESVDDIESHITQIEPINLLDGIGLIVGYRQLANEPTPQAVSSHTMTDLIPVESLSQYRVMTDSVWASTSLGPKVYFSQYGDDQQIILQSDNGYKYLLTTSATTKYIRISYDHTSYTTGSLTLISGSIPKRLPEVKEQFSGYHMSINHGDISFIYKNSQYENMLDGHKENLADSKMLNDQGGMTNNANYISLTDYIPCEPETNYALSIEDQIDYNPSCRIAWYDADGTHIETNGHANNTPYTSPENAAWFRMSILRLNESQLHGHLNFNLVYFAKCDLPYGPPCIDIQKTFDGIYPQTSLQKKKWTVFGDSITEKNVRATANYHDFIRAETGIMIVNKGVGGSGYKTRWQNGNCMYQLAENSISTWEDSDIITCMAGINDSWSEIGANLGTYADIFDANATAQSQSVMACFNHFLDIIMINAPLAKVGIISPIPCYHTSGSTLFDFKPDNDDCDVAKFVVQCKESCRRRGIPYLDLFHTSGLRPWDSTVNAALFKCNTSDSPDGLHPNAEGHKRIYPAIREFIKTLG